MQDGLLPGVVRNVPVRIAATCNESADVTKLDFELHLELQTGKHGPTKVIPKGSAVCPLIFPIFIVQTHEDHSVILLEGAGWIPEPSVSKRML